MKTIVFAQPDSTLIQRLRREGRDFILAKDPVKTLKAMKKLNPDKYTVLAEESFNRHLVLAKQFGYKEEKLEQLKSKEVDILEAIIEGVKRDYGDKHERLEQEYRNKENELVSRLTREHEEEMQKLEKEKQSVKKIKTLIKTQIYG